MGKIIGYGVYGGKTFGGTAPKVNKHFKKKSTARKFVIAYKKKHPSRVLNLIKFG